MSDKPFFDTNVVLYAFSRNDPRSEVAESLLAKGGMQVLNEFVFVARRKLDKSWEEIRGALDTIREFCPEPVPLTLDTHDQALHIAERYKFSFFDSLIVAAALQTGARTLYSEDMRDGQSIKTLRIRNPFHSSLQR